MGTAPDDHFSKFCSAAVKTAFKYTIGSCFYKGCICCCKDYYYNDLEPDDSLKKTLEYHFMSPFQKWRNEKRRRFPCKLMVQIACIFFATFQLILFAQTKFDVTDFLNENERTFSKLFVANPVDTKSGPIDPIPSPIAYLYTTDDILDQIDFTANAYFDLSKRTVGTYGYGWADSDNESDVDATRQLTLNVSKFANGKIDPMHFSVGIEKETIDEYQIHEDDIRNPNHSIADTVMWSKVFDEMNIIDSLSMQFKISSISINPSSIDSSRCFQFTLLFLSKKDYASGNMPMTLDVQTLIRDCKNNSIASVKPFDTAVDSSLWKIILDSLVLILSLLFVYLCGRSLFNTLCLACRVRRYFKSKYKYSRWKILFPLLNFWHVGAIISNLLALIGSIMKLLLTYDLSNDITVFDATSIILGLAVFGQWCGLLRFLSYFDKYNMLLRTLYLSAPSVLRFIICTGILYIAFLLCGWLVMGPYHPKFRTFTITSDCLFSLINGDDMFTTYSLVTNSSQLVSVFSKIYLYVFVSLFIYVVLSVFISLIEDTYGTLHEEWLKQSNQSNQSNESREHSFNNHKASDFLRDFVAGQVVLPPVVLPPVLQHSAINDDTNETSDE